jgi:hypothetical protein
MVFLLQGRVCLGYGHVRVGQTILLPVPLYIFSDEKSIVPGAWSLAGGKASLRGICLFHMEQGKSIRHGMLAWLFYNLSTSRCTGRRKAMKASANERCQYCICVNVFGEHAMII